MAHDSDAASPHASHDDDRVEASPNPGALVRSWLVLEGEDDTELGAVEFGRWLTEDGATHRAVMASGSLDDDSPLPELEQQGGFVVARRADTTSLAFVRLGSRVRQMIDATSEPLAIVPHDLDRAEISQGPVLLAVDPNTTPASAAAFADDLSRSKGLPLVVVHVAAVPLMSGSPGMGATLEVLHLAYEAEEKRAEAMLAGWVQAHGLRGVRREVARGNVRHAIQSLARQLDASVIVCGTRQRTALQRALSPSCALELARFARRPVVLVPACHTVSPSAPAEASRLDWTGSG